MADSNTTTHGSLLSYFITGIGNLTIQYNYQSIAVALLVMSNVECTGSIENCRQGIQEGWVRSLSSAVIFVGSIVGQMTMGYAGDSIGRSEAMCITVLIAIIGALGSAILSIGPPVAVYAVICIFRFILGVGVGGIYPLSAIKAAEDAIVHSHPQRSTAFDEHDTTTIHQHHPDYASMAAAKAFFWQIPGAMLPWLVGYLFSYSTLDNEWKWRLVLGIGAIPACIVLVLAVMEMHLLNAINNSKNDALQKQQAADTIIAVHLALQNPDIIHRLIGTGGTWFVYDIILYGLLLFGDVIIASTQGIIAKDVTISSNTSIRSISSMQLIALSMGIPSVALTIVIMQYIGTRNTQIVSFLVMCISFTIIAICEYYIPSDRQILFVLYPLLLNSDEYVYRYSSVELILFTVMSFVISCIFMYTFHF